MISACNSAEGMTGAGSSLTRAMRSIRRSWRRRVRRRRRARRPRLSEDFFLIFHLSYFHLSRTTQEKFRKFKKSCEQKAYPGTVRTVGEINTTTTINWHTVSSTTQHNTIPGTVLNYPRNQPIRSLLPLTIYIILLNIQRILKEGHTHNFKFLIFFYFFACAYRIGSDRVS